jgi:hypothetical protein
MAFYKVLVLQDEILQNYSLARWNSTKGKFGVMELYKMTVWRYGILQNDSLARWKFDNMSFDNIVFVNFGFNIETRRRRFLCHKNGSFSTKPQSVSLSQYGRKGRSWLKKERQINIIERVTVMWKIDR